MYNLVKFSNQNVPHKPPKHNYMTKWVWISTKEFPESQSVYQCNSLDLNEVLEGSLLVDMFFRLSYVLVCPEQSYFNVLCRVIIKITSFYSQNYPKWTKLFGQLNITLIPPYICTCYCPYLTSLPKCAPSRSHSSVIHQYFLELQTSPPIPHCTTYTTSA